MKKNKIKEVTEKSSKTPIKHKLNPRQEKFCRLYATDEEFFANGVRSYIEVYKPEQKGNWYNVARTGASQILTNTNILHRIDELLEMEGLNDSYVDKRLAFWITQTAHPSVSVDAVKEYNKLKNRITDNIRLTVANEIKIEVVKKYDNAK